jgi:hypothetical protein
MNMDPLMPPQLYQNILSLEMVKLVHKLLCGGCFSTNDELERPADGNIFLGVANEDKATGPASAESCTTRALMRLLVSIVSAGVDSASSPDAKLLTEKARVIRQIQRVLLGSCMYLLQLWQSSRTQAVVEEFMAAEAGRAMNFSIIPSDTVRQENPLFAEEEPQFMDNKGAQSPNVTAADLKNIATRCVDRLREHDRSTDLLPTNLQNRLTASLLDLSTYTDFGLKGDAFLFLFDLKMPSRMMLEMMTESNLITTDDDARRQQSLRSQLSTFDAVYETISHREERSPERNAAIEKCSAMIGSLIDACDDPSERPHRETMVDLGWHTRLLRTLNLPSDTTSAALSVLCLRALGVLCTDVKENQDTVAEEGLLSTVVPALLVEGEIQMAAADCVAAILLNNKRVCVLYCQEVVTTVVEALKESFNTGRLDFRLSATELLPTLIKSSYHEIYDECIPKVTKAIASETSMFNDIMRLGGSKSHKDARKKMITAACAMEDGPEVQQVEIHVAVLNTLAILGTGTGNSCHIYLH